MASITSLVIQRSTATSSSRPRSAEKSNGLPMMMPGRSTFGMPNRPLTSSVPTSATGMTGASAISAIRATPVLPL